MHQHNKKSHIQTNRNLRLSTFDSKFYKSSRITPVNLLQTLKQLVSQVGNHKCNIQTSNFLASFTFILTASQKLDFRSAHLRMAGLLNLLPWITNISHDKTYPNMKGDEERKTKDKGPARVEKVSNRSCSSVVMLMLPYLTCVDLILLLTDTSLLASIHT